jgi:uncharacterized protein (TIGR02246 family)
MTAFLDAAEISGALQQRWSAAFGQRDWTALASLYTDDAQLFGGKPDLFTKRDGVLRYFEAMPAGAPMTATFGAQHVVHLAPGVIVSAGKIAFRHAGALAEPRPYRITLVLAFQDGQWRIASHHASPE